MQRGGGELVSVYAKEPDLLKDFQKRFPNAKAARSEDEILQDFPDLTREDIRACLAFAADRERRLVAIPQG